MKSLLLILTALASLLVPSHAARAQSLTSPDGKWIVYVKPVSGDSIGTGADDYQPSELWQVDSNGRHPTLLVRCHGSFDGEMSTVVAQFNELRFSPDGRLVYFETPAWATSVALHVVDTTNGREHFICAGGIDSFRGNNLVTEESVYKGHGHQIQKFLRSPEGQMLGIVSQPYDR
jgi:dipeptidyl aminopeptidase/acylaminoacyl peptidase